MKKVLIVLALVALAIVPVAAKGVAAVGLELGQPTGITFNYDIDKKWDGYATVAFGFGKASYINALVGGQYKVTDLQIGKADFDVNVGLQAGALFWFGEAKGVSIAARATGAVSYDWTWKNVGDFTAYIRLGIGYGFAISDGAKGGISWSAALGCVYHL